MKRRALVLTVLALVALAAVAATIIVDLRPSQASFTTTSASAAIATADTNSSWVHVYSQATDPDGLTGYATRYNTTPTTRCASGQDEGISISMGTFPAWTSGTYTFNRVITLKTPAAFPDASITSVSVAVARVADSGTGRQPLSSATLNTVGSAGGTTSVSLGLNQKVQLNVTVATTWWWYWIYGGTYTPHVTLTLSYAGAPTGYYVYDYPVAVTIR